MTFTVEDALMSPMGLAVLSGAGLINHEVGNSARVHCTIEKSIGKNETDETVKEITIELADLQEETGLDNATSFLVCDCIPIYATVIGSSGKASDFLDVIAPTEPITVDKDNNAVFVIDTDKTPVSEGTTVVVDFYLAMTNSVQTISIGPEDFGGYYYVEAQTLFRDEATGKDLAANITFPKVKIQSGFTFTMAASGDPSTFSFTMDAFPGYTIARCDKKTMCDIQILSISGSEEDVCLDCDEKKPEFDTPSFKESLDITSVKIPSDKLQPSMIGYATAVANQDATIVAQVKNEITISEEAGKQWAEFESDNPAQGIHEWVGLIIDTGEKDITKVTFNGTALTQDDVDEAASVGAGAGKFVLWVKAEDTEHYPRTITLGTEGKKDTDIIINIVNG